jgi:hypothetical protein
MIGITGTDDRDPPECMIRITGIGDRDQTESVITIDRNSHSIHLDVPGWSGFRFWLRPREMFIAPSPEARAWLTRCVQPKTFTRSLFSTPSNVTTVSLRNPQTRPAFRASWIICKSSNGASRAENFGLAGFAG